MRKEKKEKNKNMAAKKVSSSQKKAASSRKSPKKTTTKKELEKVVAAYNDKLAKRFVYTWRNKFLTVDAKTIKEMADILCGASEALMEMAKDGVTPDPGGGTEDDYATLVTTNPKVAAKHGMELEENYEEDEDEDDGDCSGEDTTN